METYALLSLGAFVGLTIHFTFHTVSALVTRRHKSVVNDFVVDKASATEKDSNEYRPKVFIPNTLARWPWTHRINPCHAMVAKESEAWMASLGAFSPKAQHALFGRSPCLYGLPNSEERQVATRLLINGF
jgi:hypothetical protein